MNPARKDEEGIEPDIRPDLRVIPGGGETTSDRPARGRLQAIGDTDSLADQEKAAASGAPQTDSVANGEDSPSFSSTVTPKNKSSRTVRKVKLAGLITRKRGIWAAVIFVLGLGGLGLSAGGPAAFFLQFSNTWLKFDDSASSLNIRTRLAFSQKVGAVKNGFKESSDGKCDVKCQRSTISEAAKKSLESPTNKFQAELEPVELEKGVTRYIINSLTFPDGQVATSSAEFDALMKDTGRARDFRGVFNSGIRYFLSGSKFASFLRTKLELDRLPKASGDTKEAIDESIRKTVGASGKTAAEDAGATKETTKEKVGGKISAKVSAGAGKVSNIGGATCLVYDTTRIATAATKLQKLRAFAAFALIFTQQQDTIMSGDADQNIISTLGAQLTDQGSATDAQIYKEAANGDVGTSDSKFTLNPSGALVSTLATVSTFVGANAASRAAFHTGCSGINNPAASVVQCIPAFIEGLAAAGVGSLISGGACLLTDFAVGKAISATLQAVLPTIIGAIADGDLTLPDETTRGKEAGQVIGLGVKAGILTAKSQGYGLKPATSKGKIAAYQAATADDQQQQAAIARLDAAEKPLDLSNQYTFVGAMASKLNLAGYRGASVFGALTRTLDIVPRSFASITSAARAETSPLGYDKSTLYSSGSCPTLDAIGVVADSNCTETYVMSDAELHADINGTIDALVASGDVNADTGEAIKGSDYDKYNTYCGAGRIDPMGETSGSIADDDYEWEIGAQCSVESEHMNNIRVYVMDTAINQTIDVAGNATPDQALTAKPPLDPGYTISDGFGPRTSPCEGCTTLHPAVDLVAARGVPVYSIMDGQVMSVETDDENHPVSIKHANGAVSKYLHMDTADIKVKAGDTVKAGQQIGTVGLSGQTTGAHLDFRIYIDSMDLTKQAAIAAVAADASSIIAYSDGHRYINPILYMKAFGVSL